MYPRIERDRFWGTIVCQNLLIREPHQFLDLYLLLVFIYHLYCHVGPLNASVNYLAKKNALDDLGFTIQIKKMLNVSL